jgi:hypothetical protein
VIKFGRGFRGVDSRMEEYCFSTFVLNNQLNLKLSRKEFAGFSGDIH